jgi:hypothetical protein
VSLAAAERRFRSFGSVRIGIVLSAMALGASVLLGFLPWWTLAAPAVAYFWSGGPLGRVERERDRLRRAVAFYERALARLDGRWAAAGGETGDRFHDATHLYARDLDLFGHASLFELLNTARTTRGEETLASWLKAPAPPATIAQRQAALVELAARVQLREDLAVLGDDADGVVKADALTSWAELPPQFSDSRVPVWAWVLSIVGLCAFVALLVVLASWLGVLSLGPELAMGLRLFVMSAFVVCAAAIRRHRDRISASVDGVEGAARSLGLLSDLLRRLEAERFETTRLAELRAWLDVEGQPASRRLADLDGLKALSESRDHYLVRVAGTLVLWDLHLAFAIERWRRISGASVRRWLQAVAEIEALSSLAGYHFEHPDDVFAEFVAGPPCFEADGLSHPLLSEAVGIRNDVRLAGEVRVLIVSGSNMSGKSTLLRAVGLNAVLAQAGAPVRARRLRLTPMEIGASIRVLDSLHAGVSRFYAEAARLGQIMRRASEAPPLLFLIDELLHGTNSSDRRVGAEAIVRGLVDRGAIGLITTHDLALADIVGNIGTAGANVHFQDLLEDGRMRFDYLMRPGVVQKSNALALLRAAGVEV